MNGSDDIWEATVFRPTENLSPGFLFPVRCVNSPNRNFYLKRFCIRRRFARSLAPLNSPTPLKTMAIYTDGACSYNGLPNARGGYAFVFNADEDGVVAEPLEPQGPTGHVYRPTSNRAELRAVIAALQFRGW